MADQVTVRAHAKANLFLRVLAREESGYHSIETLFTLLDLHDELRVERTNEGIQLAVEGADTGPPEENLAYRAAAMVLQATGATFGVKLHLTKRIPVQSGLGGGSSDGAAALHAVNALANNAVPRHELLQFAAKLGSDVTFFFSGAPLALAWGRGERLMRLPAPPASPILIAVPPFGISTKRAYEVLAAAMEHDPRRGAVILDETLFHTWGGMGRLGGNDFEGPVFAQEPQLRDVFERMAATRPLLLRLSGSGSAVVAVYKSERDRDGAALEIGEKQCKLLRTTTRPDPAPAPQTG